MDQQLAEGIARSTTYKKLVGERSRLGWILTLIMLVAYFTFLYLVAYAKGWLAQPISDGFTTTLSIPVGLGLIVLTIALTGLYVRQANNEYDKMTEDIRSEFAR